MKILIVNDDGYKCEGIIKLATALHTKHDVTVIAPVKCMSGNAHAMTFGKPIHLKEITGKRYPFKCYSLNGTPADCVKLGIDLMPNNIPDLVISGINTEPNIGTTVVYSGTAGAAMEANLLGVPSLAVSANPESDEDFDYIVNYFMDHFDFYLHLSSKEYALNININNERIGNIAHVITPIGKRLFSDIYLVGTPDEHGVPYTLVGNPIQVANADDCDVIWYSKGYSTLTPLTSNHTFFTAMTRLKSKAKKYV